MNDERDLLEDLARLPARDASAESAERTRARALAALADARAVDGAPLRAGVLRAARRGMRWVTPIVVATTVGGYLTFAVNAANALFR